MNEVICKYKKTKGVVLDGGTIQRYRKTLSQIYNYLLIMRNTTESISHNSGKLSTNIIYTRYPYIFSWGKSIIPGRKKVVFLGEDFLSAINIDHKEHIKIVNKCLDFLRKNYGEKYELIYKPHPRWNRELKVLDLSKFIVYRGHDPAEMYFIKNRENIYLVFSVISTASRSAINAGLPSYVFYRIFPFKKSVMVEWKSLLGKMPKESLITSFSKLPEIFPKYNFIINTPEFATHLTEIVRKLIKQE
jgi:hypothetical protein